MYILKTATVAPGEDNEEIKLLLWDTLCPAPSQMDKNAYSRQVLYF